MNTDTEKIQKFISASGLMSRRKAEEEIPKGYFKINNKIATLGDRVSNEDKVYYKNKLIHKKKKLTYLVLNKPKYVLSTLNDPQGRKTIKDVLKTNEYLYPIGRLDYDTTGIILITNDGELTNKLLHPRNEIKRVYIATLEHSLSNDDLIFLNSKNVFIDGTRSIQEVKHLEDDKYQVTLTEGRYHHVKKLFNEVNNKVTYLHRKSFAFIDDKNLRKGQVRSLSPEEINLLKNL